MVSGRDYQLRYALWRLLRAALGSEGTEVARVRVEWPVPHGKGNIFVDALLEGADGNALEIVECKEHESFIAVESIRSFLENAAKLRSNGASFRFVTNARYVRAGGRVYDFIDGDDRVRGLDALGLKSSPGVIWDVGAPGKSQLTGDCIFHFAKGRGDAHEIYAGLYVRLAAQMALRRPKQFDQLLQHVRDLQLELMSETFAEDLEADGDFLGTAEVRRLLARRRRSGGTIARHQAVDALRRNLFHDTNVSLGQLFVEPETTLSIADPQRKRSVLSFGGGMGMLFRWLGNVRDRAVARKPLILLGPFGSGKSSLLTAFAARASETSAVTPILVPLRDILAAGRARSLRDEVVRHVKETRGIDLATPHPDDALLWCLICDGFDELNLFYSGRDDAKWVDQCFRDLASMALRSDIAVVISSRPILFMDLTSAGHPADGCPQLEIRPFEDEHIRLWCSNYRRAADLPAEFSWEFLEERNLVEVAQTPIVLFMIARIYETAPEMLARRKYTRADIYGTFISWTVRGGYRADEQKHYVPENYRQILQEIAWHMFQSGAGVADRKGILAYLRGRFGEMIDDIPVDDNLLVAHMFRPITADGPDRRLIEFSHQSFREYLVAERAWDLLEPARRSGALDAKAWNELSGKLFTTAKVSFLTDMVSRCTPEEARALFHALAHAENVHSYWNEFSKPLWARLEAGAATLKETREKFETLAVRAIAQAVLAFLLRIKALQQIPDRQDILAEVEPVGTLRRLLEFQKTFGETGLVAASRDLLLRNLEGLQSKRRRVDATGIDLDNANLTRVELAGCDFSRGSFVGTDLIESSLTSCIFAASDFRPRMMDEVVFEGCDFSGATITFGSYLAEGIAAPPHERITFRRCKFDRALIQRISLVESLFEDCTWTGAMFAPRERHAVLASWMDLETFSVLRDAGVALVE